METWAKETAERLRNEDMTRRIEGNQFLEKQQARRALGPKMFADVREFLKQNYKDLNKEMGKDILLSEVRPQSEAIIRRLDKPRILHVHFDEDSGTVRYSCGAVEGVYLISIQPDLTAFFETLDHIPHTAKEIAKFLLKVLMR